MSIYRFLQKAKWTPDEVAFEVFRMIVDTLLPGISDRVFCLPYAARLWWPQKAKVKPVGEKHQSKSELGAQLIRLTRSWLDPSITVRVIVDGGYSNKQLLQGRPQGVHITGKVRMDAALYDQVAQAPSTTRGRPRKKGERLPCPKSLFAHHATPWECIWISLYVQETIVSVHRFEAIWYKAAGNEPLAIVMVRDPGGKYPDTVFFDTDTAASDAETIQRFSHRWSIEITNRETKSLLGSADSQCRCEKSVTRAPLMAYWSYCFVVVWFVYQFRNGKDLLISSAPWYSKRNVTFSDMLAAARRSHFIPGISRDPSEHPNNLKFCTSRFPSRYEFYERAKL